MYSTTRLSGLLTRAPDGWRWARSGDPELRVYDTHLRDYAPRFRTLLVYGRPGIGVPDSWELTTVWSGDLTVRAVILWLCRRGERALLFEQTFYGGDPPTAARRPRVGGSLVRLDRWNLVMGRQVPTWSAADGPGILERAVAESLISEPAIQLRPVQYTNPANGFP